MTNGGNGGVGTNGNPANGQHDVSVNGHISAGDGGRSSWVMSSRERSSIADSIFELY